MYSPKTKFLIAAIATALFLPQTEIHSQSKKELLMENNMLKDSADVLRAKIKELEEEKLVRSMLEVRDEEELRFILTPDEFSQEATDSLLDIWYIHNQIGREEFCLDFDIDTMEVTSNVPDSVYIRRLEEMNSIIPLPYNEVVRKYIILYSEKMPSTMKKVIGLCSYYMPIFQETFNRYGLPEELKAVSIIESMLNPTAVSRAGAKGAWQFMYASGKAYGLEIDSYVDERFDPEKSADAAARYLLDSYNIFGDWCLAIASYNCGPGNVNKAIKRAGGKRDFWAIYNYLPKETRGYVPAFVGALYTLYYYKEYGLQPNPVSIPDPVDTMQICRKLHFGQVNELVGVPMEDLRKLNPQYVHDIVPGTSSKPYKLKLPYNYIGRFVDVEDSLYTYRDSLYFGLGKSDGKAYTPTNSSSSAKSSASSSTNKGGYTTYKVKAGDSLYLIAKKYKGVTADRIKSYNGLKSTVLRPGQVLKIPR